MSRSRQFFARIQATASQESALNNWKLNAWMMLKRESAALTSKAREKRNSIENRVRQACLGYNYIIMLGRPKNGSPALTWR